MQHLLTHLKQRAGEDWIIGCDSRELASLTAELCLYLKTSFDIPPKIILSELDPLRFLASFIAACTVGCPVFLCNPHWGKAEWEQVFNLVQPDLIWGETPDFAVVSNSRQNQEGDMRSHVMIPTGGSSGNIRFAIHTWETLTASVAGFTNYFNVVTINSFCVLPLYHVSGLMQFIRSFTTGGRFIISPFKLLQEVNLDEFQVSDFFLSLVPTQLQRLLELNPGWLSQFNTVLLGGAPAWEELLEKTRFHQIPLAPTYGMTETASQVVTLKPKDFLQGNNTVGRVLPHAQVMIAGKGDRTGMIKIKAASLFLGYYPNMTENREFLETDDLGCFDEQGYLQIYGRSSHKIITGGENVFPVEVESAIRATDLVTDICVIGLPDKRWGQAVTAIYVPINPQVSAETLKRQIQERLSRFKIPKYWIRVNDLPRNRQGKINTQHLEELAIMSLASNYTAESIESSL